MYKWVCQEAHPLFLYLFRSGEVHLIWEPHFKSLRVNEYEVLEGGVLKRDKNGKLVSKKGQTNGKKYFYSINMANRKLAADWGKLVAEKTKQYFANLY